MLDANRFYCEEQLPGLPDGWDSSRADWEARMSAAVLDQTGEELSAVEADQAFARENGHHLVAAGGFVGTWPVEPARLSKKDALGGVRIGYPGAKDPYTCPVCDSPIRMLE